MAYPVRDVIVVGASAGSLTALQRLVGELPADLPAAVLVVVHVQRTARSHLADILGRSTPMEVASARHGDPVVPGRILVACPDRHLLVEHGRVHLWDGPLEHGCRPAVDPLFRSAAGAYGGRLAAVVLSGTQDDGSAGLVAVRRHGGVAIVQAPWEARFPEMPRNAMESDDPQYVERAAEIGHTLSRLARGEEAPPAGEPRDMDDELEDELEPLPGLAGDQADGVEEEGGVPIWVAHPAVPAAGQNEGVERALWEAVRALEEQSSLARSLHRRARRRQAGGGTSALAARYAQRAQEGERAARVLRRLLTTRALDQAG
jgi:two-component system, chemotaxis family, protein-glutamate methylesterase/glutaminase